MKVKMITIADFVALMYNAKGRFCGLQSVTTPSPINKKDRTTGEPWEVVFPGVDKANVRKIAHAAALAGPDYKRIIERRHEKIEAAGGTHGTYEAGETWHEAVPGTKCLRRHKVTGELYAYFAFVSKVRKGNKWIPLKPKTRIVDIATGKDLDKAVITAGFLKKEYAPKNQGLDANDAVIVHTYKLDSIRALTVDGTTYAVVTK